jgi:hypothetical protein
MRLLSRVIVFTAAAAIAAPQAAKAQTYDVGADFSLSNPSGVWSYGSKATPLGAFTAYALSGTSGTLQYWTSNVGGDLTPGVFHNVGAAFTSGTVNYAVGETAFHPGPNGEISVFRFTAPTAGSYTLASRFYGLDFQGPTNTNVAIVLPGAAVTIGVGNVLGYRDPSEITYNGIFALAAGDVLEFQVDRNGNYAFDTTAIDASLSLAAVPEPATVALVAGGLLALGGVARRKRRTA